jgi:hypothetical protein
VIVNKDFQKEPFHQQDILSGQFVMENLRQLSYQGDFHRDKSFYILTLCLANLLVYISVSSIFIIMQAMAIIGSFQQQHIRPGLSAADNFRQQSKW